MRRLLGTLMLALMLTTGAAPAAFAAAPTDIVVEDEADVLDQDTLLPAIENIDFYEPTKVAVYTYRGSADDNLNEEVLRFARSEHPEWLSEDGQKWADGLFIFALDPVGRWVGTYMGEDRKVSLEQREDIQEATKDLFRDAQWTEGTIAGIERGADLINRPWYRSGVAIGGMVVGALGIVGGTGAWIAVRCRNRAKGLRERERGDRSYVNVTMDLDATEVNANTIPASSEHGALVLEKYRGFMTRFNAASELNAQAHAMTDKDLAKGRNVKIVEKYAATAEELDDLDDVIADSNTFLNLASGWGRAWDRQIAPLREDLEGLEHMLDGPKMEKRSVTGEALLSFRDATLRDFEQWAAGLESGTTTPDQALRLLRDARAEFTELLKQHSETVISGYAKDNKEAELMRKDMESSMRAPARHRRDSILDTVNTSYIFYSMGGFNTGFTAGQSSVQTARSQSSTTGYGSSGGSFSGSGSSSRF